VALSRWRKALLTSTKGQIIDLLRPADRTVEELATALGLTDNAIRAHLQDLEGQGLVLRTGERPGIRRPAATYKLAPGAELLFSEGYVPFLDQLLHVLAGTMSLDDLHSVIRKVGRRLVSQPADRSAPLAARVQATAKLLKELGGVIEIEKRGNGGNGIYLIHGRSCPFASIVRLHPEACIAVESLVAEMTGARARESCESVGDAPRCHIEVSPRPSRGRARTARP
jgi:DeoR family suf operon transcriptional repressor